MSIVVATQEGRMLSVPESSSVICADLPVRQESLDSGQMAQAEGQIWGWVAVGVGIAVAGWFIGEAIEDAIPDCDKIDKIVLTYDIDDNEIQAEIHCADG